MKLYPPLNPPNKTTINKKNAGFKAGTPKQKNLWGNNQTSFQIGPPAFVERKTHPSQDVELDLTTLEQEFFAKVPKPAALELQSVRLGFGGRPVVETRVGEFPMGKGRTQTWVKNGRIDENGTFLQSPG